MTATDVGASPAFQIRLRRLSGRRRPLSCRLVVGALLRSRHPGRRQLVAPPGAVRGSATHPAMGLARWRAGPFGSDDRVELGPQQFPIGQQQLEELLHGAAAGRRATATSQVPCHHASPCQALMACFSSPCWVISILRGLACSATGMVKVNTPAS